MDEFATTTKRESCKIDGYALSFALLTFSLFTNKLKKVARIVNGWHLSNFRESPFVSKRHLNVRVYESIIQSEGRSNDLLHRCSWICTQVEYPTFKTTTRAIYCARKKSVITVNRYFSLLTEMIFFQKYIGGTIKTVLWSNTNSPFTLCQKQSLESVKRNIQTKLKLIKCKWSHSPFSYPVLLYLNEVPMPLMRMKYQCH